MSSQQELAEEEVINPLPPLISTNLREKLYAEQVSIGCITHNKRKSIQHKITKHQNITKTLPRPLHDLEIIWCPRGFIQRILDFEIDDVAIVHRLRIWNPCSRSIYLHCCGFWDETCRLGAYWHCYPRTRFLLAPGLPADLYIQATPRDFSPIQYATVALQLAAAHKRDIVVGYFVIPIRVKFLKYLPPPRLEEGE